MGNNKIYNLNSLALYIFSCLILAAGGLAFFIPQSLSFMSTTHAYNLFRVNLGLIGIIVALTYKYGLIKYFNFFTGIIYLYQVIANMFNLFPKDYFHWSTTDVVINTDIGLSFILISLLGIFRKQLL